MKIDLVIPSSNVGGSERQPVGLKATGHDVHVITLHSRGALEGELLDGGVLVFLVGSSTGIQEPHGRLLEGARSVRRMVHLGRRHARQPESVQAWLPKAQVIALPVAALLRIPQRTMALRSMSAAARLTSVKRRLLRTAALGSTLVTANACAILDDPGWPIAGRPCRVISNAVSAPVQISTPGRQPPLGIVVANLPPIKGHHLLVEALALLDDPPSFIFVGSGKEKEALTKRIVDTKLESKVQIMDGVNDPGFLLSEAQMLVLPSLSEGLPNAVLETMAAGLPTIAFRVGGIPEIVVHGETGLLVEPGDVRGLARAIAQAANDPAWRERAGACAAARARLFSWESVINENFEMMQEVSTTGLDDPKRDIQ